MVFTGVDEAERRVEYLYTTVEGLAAAATGDEGAVGKGLEAHAKLIAEAPDRVMAALDKDLNTPVALSVIAELAKGGNEIALSVGRLKKDAAAQGRARGHAAAAVATLDACCKPLGLMLASHEEFAARCGGASYQEIAAKGGGIASTVAATREGGGPGLEGRCDWQSNSESRWTAAVLHGSVAPQAG